jgi:hypothetical protein
MPTGEHTAVVTARDDLEQTGSASVGFTVQYLAPPSATASIQEHCEAGRIPWSEFSTYYLMYGREPFTVYQWPDGRWREEEPDAAAPPTRACVTDTLSAHVEAERAYVEDRYWWWWLINSYYARGSDELLGTLPSATASLMETQPGHWSRVEDCP